MKKFVKIIAKALVVIVLFGSASIIVSASGVKTIAEARAKTVSEATVIDYLVARGYQINDLYLIPGSDNWQADTYLNGVHYQTTVFVRDGQIVGNEDIVL
jgi:hypothetical protein